MSEAIQQEYYDDVDDFQIPQQQYLRQLSNNSFDVQLKTETFLNQLKLGWLALYDDPEKGLMKIENVKPVMNVCGAETIISFIRGKLHQFNSLSFLKDDDIRFLMRDASIAITKLLIYNYEKFEIDKRDIPVIENVVESAIFSNYKRAYKGFTSNQINKNTTRVERSDDNRNENKFKIF